MAKQWYNAFARIGPEDRSPVRPRDETRGFGAHALANAAPDARRDMGSRNPAMARTLESVVAPSPTAEGAFATMLRFQSDDLEHLARQNERLMDRIQTLLQLQEREQVLRQQLQTQVERLSHDVAKGASLAPGSVIRTETRAGIAEEVKPILIAMLGLLERIVPRAADAPPPAPSGVTAPIPPTPASTGAAPEKFQRLPDILTQPIEVLTGATHDRGPPRRRLGDTGETGTHDAARFRTRPEAASPGPGFFVWTNIFS